jgi:hypothetical protein
MLLWHYAFPPPALLGWAAPLAPAHPCQVLQYIFQLLNPYKPSKVPKVIVWCLGSLQASGFEIGGKCCFKLAFVVGMWTANHCCNGRTMPKLPKVSNPLFN